MHALAVMHLGEGSGPPEHVRPWLEALALHGKVTVIVPERGRVASLYESFADVQFVSYRALTRPRSPLALARLARDLVGFTRVLRRTDPDLVVVVTSVVPAALLAARLRRIPTIAFVAEILAGTGRRQPLGTALERFTARFATVVVPCSQTLAARYRALTPRVHTIIPGIRANVLAGDGRAFRDAHGIEAEDPCLAIVGNIAFGRGQDIAVRAVALLRTTHPTVRLLIVGAPLARAKDLRFRDELVQLVETLGLASAVSFTGFVENVGDAYAAADVVVNPARAPEALGLATLEAMAAGCPVVATRVGGLPDVLDEGRNGLLVPPNDPEAIASAAARLLTDRDFRDRIATHGRRRAADFDEQTGAARFVDLATSLVDQAR